MSASVSAPDEAHKIKSEHYGRSLWSLSNFPRHGPFKAFSLNIKALRSSLSYFFPFIFLHPSSLFPLSSFCPLPFSFIFLFPFIRSFLIHPAHFPNQPKTRSPLPLPPESSRRNPVNPAEDFQVAGSNPLRVDPEKKYIYYLLVYSFVEIGKVKGSSPKKVLD